MNSADVNIYNLVNQWDIPKEWLDEVCVLLESIVSGNNSLFFVNEAIDKETLIQYLYSFGIINNIEKLKNLTQKRIILFDSFGGSSREENINEAQRYLKRILVNGISEIIYPNWGDTPLDFLEIILAMYTPKSQPCNKLPRHNRWPLRGLFTTKVKKICKAIGKLSCNVLITGPSGIGKEAVARLIHAYSNCRGNFVSVSVPSIPGELFSSILFGYEKGAYTDAKHNQKGYFEMASNGTLFMDEIADIEPRQQAILLRALAERRGTTIDGTRDYPITCRVITATNRLDKLRNSFRPDLRIRLAEQEISYALDNNDWHPLKSLSMIPEQIPLLFSMQLARVFHEQVGFGTTIANIKLSNFAKSHQNDVEVLNELSSYKWPMNFRELAVVALHALLRAVVNNDELLSLSLIQEMDFIIKLGSRYDDNQSNSKLINDSEMASFLNGIPTEVKKWDFISKYIREEVVSYLRRMGYNDSKCAEYLGIDRSSLSRFIGKAQE